MSKGGDGRKSFEEMASELERTGQYRVLRRLLPKISPEMPWGEGHRLAVFLDFETTGLDPSLDGIIEIGMVPFSYTEDGKISAVGQAYQALQEPTISLPPEISNLTGLTENDLIGKSINWGEVAEFIRPAVLIVAHNAAFDRPFAEAAHQAFAEKAWACSMTDVPWAQEGFDGSRLGYLLTAAGYFFDGHRAADDCYAALELLKTKLPRSGTLAFKALLDNARCKRYRIWAPSIPYEHRQLLKARSYRWSNGGNGRPRAWYKDLSEVQLEDEKRYLQTLTGSSDIPIEVTTAFERFSSRA